MYLIKLVKGTKGKRYVLVNGNHSSKCIDIECILLDRYTFSLIYFCSVDTIKMLAFIHVCTYKCV